MRACLPYHSSSIKLLFFLTWSDLKVTKTQSPCRLVLKLDSSPICFGEISLTGKIKPQTHASSLGTGGIGGIWAQRHYFDGSYRHDQEVASLLVPETSWEKKQKTCHSRNNTHDLTHEKLEKICTILPVINLIRSGVSGTSSNILITRPCYAYETLSSFELPVWKQFIAVTLRKLFWLPNYWRDVSGVQSQCWVSKGEGHTYNRTDGS